MLVLRASVWIQLEENPNVGSGPDSALRPLFTRYAAPSSKSGLVQLGLDDNNQVRVYRY